MKYDEYHLIFCDLAVFTVHCLYYHWLHQYSYLSGVC